MLNFLKNMMGGGPQVDFPQLLKDGAIILDVRTPAEYRGGHVAGSKNVPLNELGRHTERLAKKGKVVITCCASGARSGMAARNLNKAGIEAYNGGPWTRVNGYIAAMED